MRKKTKRWFHFWKLPSPSELGMSDSDALGIRYFTPFQPGPTWEDWRLECKKRFPIRYFLNEVVAKNLRTQISILEHRIYKYKSLFYHKQHLLDLRNVDKLGHYSYGYITPAEIIRLSSWKALMIYVEEIKPRNPETECGFNERDKTESWYKDRLHAYKEAMTLYRYWTIERISEDKEIEELHRHCDAAKDANNESDYRSIMKAILLARKQFEKKEEKMLVRLVKISSELID